MAGRNGAGAIAITVLCRGGDGGLKILVQISGFANCTPKTANHPENIEKIALSGILVRKEHKIVHF